MDVTEIAARGKFFNSIIIIVNIITYAVYTIGRFSASNAVYGIQIAVRVIGVIAAIVCIVFAGLMLKENDGRLKGLGLLLASSIVSLIFSALGFMLGIVIWILSGISITLLQRSLKEQLDTRMYSNIEQNIQLRKDIEAGYYNKNNSGNYNDPFAGNNQGYGQDPNFGTYGQDQSYGSYGQSQTYGQNPNFGTYGQDQSYGSYGQSQTYGQNQTYGGPGQGYNGDPFASGSQGYTSPEVNPGYTGQDPFASGSKGYGDGNNQ